jgi:hypothetical protein
VGVRARLRRLQAKVEHDGVVLRQRDGTLKAFEVMHV